MATDQTPPHGDAGEPDLPSHTYSPPIAALKNARELGAWAYGVACGLSGCGDAGLLYVEIPADRLEGAVAVIVAGGGNVRRSGRPAAEGNVMLHLSCPGSPFAG